MCATFSSKMIRHSRSGFSLVSFLALLALVAVALSFFFRVYRVPQAGMWPTIEAGGFTFARLQPYKSSADVQRGDVIVFEQGENDERQQCIWRVIAIGGDTIALEGRSVTINGKRLLHREVREEGESMIVRETNHGREYNVAYDTNATHPGLPLAARVEPGYVFVLGDNRDAARDSTYIGAVPFTAIVAKKL